jgi:mannose-6-phosphate isomerase
MCLIYQLLPDVPERSTVLRPVILAPNMLQRPYRGGSVLADFRGIPGGFGERFPEDWIASTTTVRGDDDAGLTVMPSGETLRDAVASDPGAYLSPAHREVYGSHTGLLLKLIDAQQRLAVHVHPTREFARSVLGECFGKTEAWYVAATGSDDAAVHIGFSEDIADRELVSIVESEQGSRLLERMHRVPVQPGDAIFVPGGTPHAIGKDVFLVEVQEPTDLLVRLEWAGYAVGAMPSDLGLGFAQALSCVNHGAWSATDLDGVRGRYDHTALDTAISVLPAAADAFFRLDVAKVVDQITFEADFSVLIILAGTGQLSTGADSLSVQAGQSILLPFGCGDVEVCGDVTVARARPGDPATVALVDPELVQPHRSHHHES